ncbi:hypothetical protein GCM10011399_03930 [Subtercola lobariae]|uniref:Uncharacterized protein n=1 Tax=Subtercola lobariae TaxID=1588641 RepID=A0A917B061_9MICO|nr:hypothetical protein GCM10011399_03930 [Subtercola lobariae]
MNFGPNEIERRVAGEEPPVVEIVEAQAAHRGNTNREQGAVRCRGWQHSVQANAVMQPNIDAGVGLVDVTATERDEPHGKLS